MTRPYTHPYPYPQNYPGPYIYPESGPTTNYPYPVPSVELYPDSPWPKSLCYFAPECPVADDLQDLEPAKECKFALKYGCPLFLVNFSEFESFADCKNVELFEIGQDESKDYTEDHLDEIVKNFQTLKDKLSPPLVVLGHGENQDLLYKSGLPSAGWVENLRRVGKKLIADFKEVPQKIAELINKKAYRFPSVEIYRQYIDNSENLGHVLRRVALLGADIPKIKSLDDILARYEEPTEETLWLGGETVKGKEIRVAIFDLDGSFSVSEEITNEKGAKGTILEAYPSYLLISSESEEGFAEGVIVGSSSKAKARIRKEATPPEPEIPDKPSPQDTLSEEMKRLSTAFSEKEKEVSSLKAESDAQAEKVKKIESELEAERLKAHRKEVELFCETLKKKGLAPAVVDELALHSYAMVLDWKVPVKFSESADPKTHFQQFSELLLAMVDRHAEDKLFVPLGTLEKIVDTETVIPAGIDEEGYLQDKEITKYAEEHKVSYEEAYKIIQQKKKE